MTKKRPRTKVEPPPSTPLERSLREYREWLGLRGFTESTGRSKLKSLRRLSAWLAERGTGDPAEVTAAVLERWRRWLFHRRKTDGTPLACGTQYSLLSAARGYFHWLAKSGRLPSNPASELELPRLGFRLPKATLSAGEAERVLAAVFETGAPSTVDRSPLTGNAGAPAAAGNSHFQSVNGERSAVNSIKLRDRAILEILYATGMRRKELANLKLYDLDLGRGTVMIRQGKGKKDRVIPLGERASAWAELYLREGRPELAGPALADEGWLFLTRRGVAFTPDSLSVLARGYVARAGLGKTGACHLFRHTMATLMLEGGADIRFIQEMLGHARLNTTELYTRVSIRKLAEIHAATHPGAKLKRGQLAAGGLQLADEAGTLAGGHSPLTGKQLSADGLQLTDEARTPAGEKP